MISNNVYQFRVQVEDIPYIDFLLHIVVQQNQLPKYFDLMNKIKECSKSNILNVQEYYIMIRRDGIYKFKFNNDIGLQNTFQVITEKDRLEIKLMKLNGTEPYSEALLKPIFIKSSGQIEYQPIIKKNDMVYNRKDSGISFDMDIFKSKPSTRDLIHTKKMPKLSNIITTQPVQWTPFSPQVKLPGLSSFISESASAYSPCKFVLPQSPPLSASSDSVLIFSKHKRARGGSVPHQSQFICDHVNTETGKVCSQTFRRSYDLSRHQFIHLKNRPFCYCRTCDKKFTRLDALRRHERIQGHNK